MTVNSIFIGRGHGNDVIVPFSNIVDARVGYRWLFVHYANDHCKERVNDIQIDLKDAARFMEEYEAWQKEYDTKNYKSLPT